MITRHTHGKAKVFLYSFSFKAKPYLYMDSTFLKGDTTTITTTVVHPSNPCRLTACNMASYLITVPLGFRTMLFNSFALNILFSYINKLLSERKKI